MALGLFSVILLFWFPGERQQPAGINERGFRLIHRGMSKPKVMRLLGRPPGDYSTGGSSRIVLDPYGGGILMENKDIEEWKSDDGWIQIVFDAKGEVQRARFHPVRTKNALGGQ